MYLSSSIRRPKTPLVVKLSIGIGLLIGLLLLVASAARGKEISRVTTIFSDVTRDVGIGLLVSSTVAIFFEIYRSSRHEMEAMKDVIDFVMGDRITPEIWMDVKELTEAKSVVRKRFNLRLEMEANPELESYQRILKVENDYDLVPLRNERTTVTVLHELDYRLRNDQLGLPRWESIVLEPSKATVRGDVDLKNPRQRFEVELGKRRDEEVVFVKTSRREIVTAPGSYNFYTPEFIKGIHVSVVGCPDDFEAEVWIAPRGDHRAQPSPTGVWTENQLIFPGQGIEVKFVKKSGANAPQKSAATA
jgi:hypothetical protein